MLLRYALQPMRRRDAAVVSEAIEATSIIEEMVAGLDVMGKDGDSENVMTIIGTSMKIRKAIVQRNLLSNRTLKTEAMHASCHSDGKA